MNTTRTETKTIIIGSATLVIALAMLATAVLVDSRLIFWLAVIPTAVGLYYLADGLLARKYRLRTERRVRAEKLRFEEYQLEALACAGR